MLPAKIKPFSIRCFAQAYRVTRGYLAGIHQERRARTAKHVRIEGSRFAGSDRPDHAHIVTVRQVIPQAGLRVVVRDLLRLFLRGVTTQHAGDLFLQSEAVAAKALLQIVGGDKLIIPFC